MKKTIIIDGDKFIDIKGFCSEAHKKLCPTIPFNGNLDAFNDILRGGFGIHDYEEPMNIIWKNSAKSRDVLGYKTTAKFRESWLSQVHPLNIESAKKSIEDAKQGRGDTLFEQYVNIIREHKHIKLDLL